MGATTTAGEKALGPDPKSTDKDFDTDCDVDLKEYILVSNSAKE